MSWFNIVFEWSNWIYFHFPLGDNDSLSISRWESACKDTILLEFLDVISVPFEVSVDKYSLLLISGSAIDTEWVYFYLIIVPDLEAVLGKAQSTSDTRLNNHPVILDVLTVVFEGDWGLREGQTFNCVFIYVSSLLEALWTSARELASATVRNLSFKIISSIDETKTVESYFSGTLGTNESRGNL